MSQKMVEYLIDDNYLDFSKEDVTFLQDLIRGTPTSRYSTNIWLILKDF